MKCSRRSALSLLAATITVAASAPASWAQSYPARPVRVVVPFAPGGPVDVLARLLTERLSQRLGQQFFVENQGGAGGNVGMGGVARATPDGHTITIVGPSFVVNPSLYAKVPYDPLKDFVPITLAAVSPNILLVHPSIHARNVQELIAFVRQNPGKHSFAHPGKGTTAQLGGEMFKRAQRLDLAPVSFNGSGPAIQSALGGHTPIAFTVITPAVQHVKAGTLRALAVTTRTRARALPDVPTLGEAGVPGIEADTLLGVLAPAGTPREIVARLHKEVTDIIGQLKAEDKLTVHGFEPVANSPEEFAARIKDEMAKWAKVIRDANITAD